MNEVLNLSRRRFLKTGLLAGGGLILGVHIPRLGGRAAAADEPAVFAPNAFVRVGADETVTVIVNHSEMGQGPYTSIPMVVAEELDADWSKVRFEAAPVDPAYNHSVYGIQMTGGSSSTWSEWARVRRAGAAARQMLIAAAAEAWKVEPAACKTENGFVLHAASDRKESYGKLAERASRLKPPENVTLKDPKDFKIVGKPTKRLDTPDKTNGKAVFGLDVTVPGLLVAVVARSPVFGGKVKSFNADKAKAVPGVRHVVEIERGVAVVADGFWPAKKGREALEIVWDEGPLAALDSGKQGDEYAELAKKEGAVARKDGDAAAALEKAAKKFEAVYDLPYLAHATMEPMNCTADVRADRCEVWTGTQFQTADRDAAARDAGLKPEQVQLHTTLLGGGFGRRAVPDNHFVREAVQTSKAVGAPVKVVWTREDDMRGGYYRPRAYHTVSAGLDADGALTAWRQRIVCQSFLVGTPFEALVKDGLDETAVEGAKDIPYEVPNVLVDWRQAPRGVPTLWWRSVGHSHTAFVVETFIDELAHAAGKDPYEFRRGMLAKKPRHQRVLELVAEKAGWDKPPPEGRGRGIAVHESFGSFLAHVVEVSISPEGKLRVHRVVGAIDCGPVVNPDTIAAQIEGGAVFALTAALYGEITFEKGRVKQRNFHDYRMLRMHEMPEVEAHIVPSTDKMGGVGEPGVPPVAPALANAIFALTGKRIRRLPIRAEDLRKG
jgi:isoquinoline 1-oxidoreductase beta subunit